MLTSLPLYLAEASFCLAVFALTYRLLLAGLTYFARNRAYLLGALAMSVAIPLLTFPGLADWLANPATAPGVAQLPRRLSFDPKGTDITSRYMDHGYLFFSATPKATRQPDGTTDLAFTIFEGRKAQLGRVTITGNTKTPTATLLKLIPLRSGEDFNRAKLMETQRVLAQQGQFDPNKVGINPAPEIRPNQATDLINIALLVMEKGK